MSLRDEILNDSVGKERLPIKWSIKCAKSIHNRLIRRRHSPPVSEYSPKTVDDTKKHFPLDSSAKAVSQLYCTGLVRAILNFRRKVKIGMKRWNREGQKMEPSALRSGTKFIEGRL